MERKTPPFTFEELPEEETANMKVRRIQDNNKLVRVVPSGFLLPYSFVKFAKHFYNFEFRHDDILVATFPKSGTVWMAEILWALSHFDEIHTMDTTHINLRSYFIDLDFLHPPRSSDKVSLLQTFKEMCPDGKLEDGVMLQMAKTEKKRRIIKTHLQFQSLNPSFLDTCKIVYVARNPKDVCVSLYYFMKNRPDMTVDGNFEDFVESFMDAKMTFSPYWAHLKQAWKLKDHPNFQWIFYEDLKTDTMRELQNLQKFLELDLSYDQLKVVADATSFENMKRRDEKQPLTKMEGSFFRKGTVGDWKSVASPELNARMDKWIQMNNNDGSIIFKYD
ncbi:hypothetical protein SK128_022300 [Halocaridina rubra]|uniref:Sulfotransferase domain-containing protein n=1 Tax=Halocaridina rubra TaxID=373956 RepID=A0AAN8ZT29_HALRR